MSEFTFLTKEQVVQLDILKKYGARCAITDFSILLGGFVSTAYHTSEGTLKKDHTGWWWTQTSDEDNDVCVVGSTGDIHWNYAFKRSGGARPALPYSSIASSCSNAIRCRNGILEVEYGEYPQTVVSKDFFILLEMLYSIGKINRTGKVYTTDSVNYYDEVISFLARTHIEYEYDRKKYIRFVGDANGEGKVLSDGRKIRSGEVYWLKVEPIKWMIDERANIALSKNIIFSGVRFNYGRNYSGVFDNTIIKKFIDTCFSKDIIPILKKEELNDKENLKKSLEELEKLLEKAKEEVVEIEKRVQVLKRVLSKK